MVLGNFHSFKKNPNTTQPKKPLNRYNFIVAHNYLCSFQVSVAVKILLGHCKDRIQFKLLNATVIQRLNATAYLGYHVKK